MGIGYILVGFLFLINPVIHVLDLLPDCIGFFLIMKGLSQTALFVDHLSEARDKFGKLALIELVKVFSILLWPMVSDSGMLLLTFVFSILELLYFIPATKELKEGFDFAGLWYQGEAVYAKKVHKGNTEKGRPVELGAHWLRSAWVFYGLRIACSIAPELTALQLYDYVGTVNTISLRYSDYKPFLYVLLGLIVVIVGVAWYVRTYRYWNGIRKDTAFVARLQQKYKRDILPKNELFCAMRMKKVSYCYLAAVVTSLFCVFDGVNVMVGAISAGFLIAAVLWIGKDEKLSYAVIPFAVIRAGLSVWNLIQQIRYFDDYQVEAVEWIDKAYVRYYAMAATETVEYIAAFAGLLLFLVVYWRAIRLHLQTYGGDTTHVQYHAQDRNVELTNMAGSQLLLNAALALVNTIAACAYRYALVDVASMGVICVIITLLWIAQTYAATARIRDEIYARVSGDI